jgi:hypothetical protein
LVKKHLLKVGALPQYLGMLLYRSNQNKVDRFLEGQHDMTRGLPSKISALELAFEILKHIHDRYTGTAQNHRSLNEKEVEVSI